MGRLEGGAHRRAARLALLGLSAAAVAVAPTPASGQEDFRSLEADRPTKVQDAYPLKRGEWEWEAGLRGALVEGNSAAAAHLELTSGVFLNGEVGAELELALEEEGGETATGLESAGFHALYNLNRETWSAPGLGVRLDVRTPGAGDLGHEDWGGRLLGMVSRSFDRLRLHANGGYAAASRDDGGDFWAAGLGFDYPIGLFSRTVVGDLYAEVPSDTGRSRVWAELGSRWQLSNRSVMDVGVATRLDRWEAGEANVELVVGFSRVFGVPGLTRVPDYPEPMIR